MSIACLVAIDPRCSDFLSVRIYIYMYRPVSKKPRRFDRERGDEVIFSRQNYEVSRKIAKDYNKCILFYFILFYSKVVIIYFTCSCFSIIGTISGKKSVLETIVCMICKIFFNIL